MYITEQEVIDYMMIRTDEDMRHCPLAVSEACNEVVEKFHNDMGFYDDDVTAKDLLKLLFFNDPIPSLHTHSYGFHTATGRSIIETLKAKYYEHND